MSFSDTGKTYYELSISKIVILQNIFKTITDYIAERQKRADEMFQSAEEQTYFNSTE